MEIRMAKPTDLKSICMSLYNKKIDYITPESAREDVKNNRLYLLVEDGKILGQCALKYQNQYGEPYYAVQRLVLYNNRNTGKHIAETFLEYFLSLHLGKLGVTPWSDNVKMKHILAKKGFTFQYQIDKNFEFWAT